MLVQVPTHTTAPDWLRDSVSNTKKPMPPRSETSATAAVVVISSPATMSGPQRNSWLPWTMWAKSIPTSGSNRAGMIARAVNTTANIGGATTSAWPAARADSWSRWMGLVSPTAAAYSLIFSRPIAYKLAGYVLPIASVLTAIGAGV
jgi:hypothetical protein